MKKNIIFILIILLISRVAYSQDSNIKEAENNTTSTQKNSFQEAPDSLGFYMCYPITGGLTYHRWIDKFGLQITAGGFASQGGYADYNIQLQLQGMVFGKDINDWFATSFYPFGIIGHRGHKNFDYTYAGITEEPKFTANYYVGIGIGTELLFVKHLSITLDLTLVGAYPWTLTMGGGGSLKFRF